MLGVTGFKRNISTGRTNITRRSAGQNERWYIDVHRTIVSDTQSTRNPLGQSNVGVLDGRWTGRDVLLHNSVEDELRQSANYAMEYDTHLVVECPWRYEFQGSV